MPQIIAVAQVVLEGEEEVVIENLPKIIVGAQALISDIMVWLLLLIPIAGGAMIAYHSLMKILSDGDPVVVAEKNKKIKSVLVGVVIAMSASGLVTAIIAYFV